MGRRGPTLTPPGCHLWTEIGGGKEKTKVGGERAGANVCCDTTIHTLDRFEGWEIERIKKIK